MGHLKVTFLVSTLLFSFASWGETFTGTVVGVSDGDSIEVMRSGKPAMVRLSGIDCPEIGQEFSTEAKQYTSSMVLGKRVAVYVENVDDYGRFWGNVYCVSDGRNLNQKLLVNGLAWHNKQPSSSGYLTMFENQARSARLGLWSQPNPIPPWAYREQIKEARTALANSWTGKRPDTLPKTPSPVESWEFQASKDPNKGYMVRVEGNDLVIYDQQGNEIYRKYTTQSAATTVNTLVPQSPSVTYPNTYVTPPQPVGLYQPPQSVSPYRSPPSSGYGVRGPPPYGGVAENGSYYGEISAKTGKPKTVSVRGYFRKNGTYVRGHYRSR